MSRKRAPETISAPETRTTNKRDKPASDLFLFEWAFDQAGYRLEEGSIDGPPPRKRIRNLGGPPRAYRPLQHPGLARDLAACALTEGDVLAFVTQYGFLTHARDYPRFGSEDVADWFEAIRMFRTYFELIDSGQADAAIDRFNKRVFFGLTPHIGDRATGKPKLQLMPHSLLGALCLQLSDELTGNLKLWGCKQCTKHFPFRPNKDFCSDRCRKAFSREQEARDAR